MISKILIQVIPIMCWAVFLRWRSWDMTYGESFLDWVNWVSIFIIGGWYYSIEFGYPFVSKLFKRKSKA